MRALSIALDVVYRIAGFLAGLLLILLCCLILYSIAARLLSLYAGGAADVAGYVMATSTFMALAYTFRSHGHIRVQLLVQRLSSPIRRGVEVFSLAFMSGIAVFIAWYMTRLAYDSYDFGERSQGADAILMWIPQAPVAAGAWLLAVAVVHTLIQAIFDYDAVNPEHATGPGEV